MKITVFKYPLITLSLLFFSCKPTTFDEPIVSLEAYHIVEGFDLKVVASEPFLEAPVTLDFDNKGRMWVVEMKGYMQNLEGTGEDMPNGVISIMEDLDHDGITDHAKIFLDSLVLPRAIAHVYGGLLYAEPPNLWFVDIKNDQPVNKVLVDSLYSFGGNVEHQPNGLLMSIDNWIYNAKSNFRYQRRNGAWIKEPTSFRGQWGITRDNFGRLYYNNNSNQIIGDYVLPNTAIKNPYYTPEITINNKLTTNQRVYPLHATSVNRGYSKGVLDKDSLLINVTSACGPLIYRGNQFPSNYFQNAFVCVPEANLIKRNILSFEGDKITAEQAWSNKEFIAATDEGFRPVNLFSGPDGAMYIVDMHRGIIQDKAFLTPYLQNHYATKKLDTIIGMGRILRVQNKKQPIDQIPDLENLSASELVYLLKNTNPWLRDKAQQLIITKNLLPAIPLLKESALDSSNYLAQIHALHSLNGLNSLSFDLLENIIHSSSNNLTISHSLVLMEYFVSKENFPSMLNLTANLILKGDPEINFYLASSLGKWTQLSNELFFPILQKLSNEGLNNPFVQEGIMSSTQGFETEFKYYLNQHKEMGLPISKALESTIKNKESNKKNSIYVETIVTTDSRTAGYKTFRTNCATCHGVDGNGIKDLAPPLRNSEYIKENSEKLALIILHGLHEPIHVDGKLYEFNGTMPGLVNNTYYTNKDIVNLISYLRNAFPGNSKKIGSERVKQLRNQKPKNGLFTEKELLELFE